MNRTLRQQSELVLSLAKRDLKARYKDSVLGFFWSLLRPAFLTLILWAVFAKILQFRSPSEQVPYWLHVLVSVLAWNFFAGSLFDATHSVLANANLLKKVKLDCEVFPVASILSNAIHFVLALAIVLVIKVVFGFGLSWHVVFLPFVCAILTLLILGVSLYLSALNVFYRDVSGLLDLGTLAWFYVTPIIYSLPMAAERILEKTGQWGVDLYMMNPVSPPIVALRRVLLYGGKDTEIADGQLLVYLGITFAASLVITVTGWMLFRRLSPRFADEL
ncbi:MAG: ABC transporter permease [Candidatus Sumerlaeaceae bacterium]|nr:ABC transporter permease [Candidatus Sumerlaeaceae bacterium]